MWPDLDCVGARRVLWLSRSRDGLRSRPIQRPVTPRCARRRCVQGCERPQHLTATQKCSTHKWLGLGCGQDVGRQLWSRSGRSPSRWSSDRETGRWARRGRDTRAYQGRLFLTGSKRCSERIRNRVPPLSSQGVPRSWVGTAYRKVESEAGALHFGGPQLACESSYCTRRCPTRSTSVSTGFLVGTGS